MDTPKSNTSDPSPPGAPERPPAPSRIVSGNVNGISNAKRNLINSLNENANNADEAV